MVKEEQSAANYLKPCPFCGGDPYLTTNYNEQSECWFVSVKCGVCGARGQTHSQRTFPHCNSEYILLNSIASDKAQSAWEMRSGEIKDAYGLSNR